MFFWNSLAFSMIQQMLAIWSLVPLPFLKPAWTSGSSRLMYCWSLAWRILSIALLACETSAIMWLSEHSLALPFFGIGMKTDLFQSCGHCWVFQIFWHIECSTFTASRVPEKHLFLLYWLCQSLCGSQQTVENSERDGNTRPPDLPLEKPVCRSGSNS